jgi:hypothetical protein
MLSSGLVGWLFTEVQNTNIPPFIETHFFSLKMKPLFCEVDALSGVIYGVEIELLAFSSLLRQYPQAGPTGVSYLVSPDGSLLGTSEPEAWRQGVLGSAVQAATQVGGLTGVKFF